jgi:hypothetical protein
MINISIENIDRAVVDFSPKAITVCQTLEADLNSGAVKAVEAYLPVSAPFVEGAKTILASAIGALQALHALGDTPGLKGRLLTLSTQLTDIETEGKHEWSTLIVWVQSMFTHLKHK